MPIRDGPHYTQFPDELLDFWLARLNDAEWRVLCYIVRHTFGWKKEVDAISYQQFLHGVPRRNGPNVDYGCGLRSRTTLSAALRGLEQKQLIRRVASRGTHGTVAITAYEVWVEEEEEQAAPRQEPAQAAAQTQQHQGAAAAPASVIPLSPANGLSEKRRPLSPRNGLSDARGRVHEMDSGWVQEMDPQKTTTLQKTNKQETTMCAASAAPPETAEESAQEMDDAARTWERTQGVAAEPTRRRARKMTEQEKADVSAALDRFNDRLRPIVDDEYGRFMREALQGIRGFGLAHYRGTIDVMATNPRFVDDPYVTPLTVTKTVPIWEDNGQPRTWRELEERKKRRMQNGRH